MPLGERGPGDSSDSRYCGVETDFDDDMPTLLSLHLSQTGFDFVVASLMNPTYRPSLVKGSDLGGSGVLPFAGSDLSPSLWSSHVWGKISSWIDLDSEDETLRMDSETTLKQEIAWASYLSLQVCLLPTPRGNSCANYARCVNQILQGLKDMQLLLRIPLVRAENDSDNKSSPYSGDTWELWNSFRVLCEHHSQLSVALDILTLPSEKSLGRWFGEPLRVSIISTDIFYTNNRGYPRLSRRYQKLFSEFFNHSIQVLISGKQLHKPRNGSKGSAGIENKGEGEPKHPLRPYLDYLSFLYKRMGPLPEQELSELAYRDFLQTPLQTLTDDNLEAQTYETFEKDTIKYTQYRRAIAKALLDRVSDEEAADATTVLMAIGVGVGPLVRASFQAAEETGRTLKVYAVEKNPNAVVTLVNLLKLEGWENFVNIISSSVCHWDSPEMADILVSDLLGSFGDNQLSPECIDKAQRFLKQDGISIPMSYTSFIQPITASKLYNDVRLHKDLDFESAYVVKLHNIAKLAPSQPVFTFTHPNHSSSTKSNKRYTKLQFEIPIDTVSVMVHGFAGYFDSVLYGDIHLGTEPSTSTPNMFSWFPMFFPLRSPVYVQPGSILEVHFWRCVGSTEVNKPSKGNKFWYEWWVSSPCSLPVHNPDGRSYWVRLDFDSS